MDEINEHRHDSRAERAEQVQENNGAELRHVAALGVGERRSDEHENQKRCDRFQRPDEERTEHGNCPEVRNRKTEDRADHQTDQDPYNETE